jgi:hypothetical protein
MSHRRTDGTVKERARRPLLLEDGIDDVLAVVAADGFALVRAALPEPDRRRLLEEASRAGSRFLEVPERVNGVHQHADQLSLRVGDPRCPVVNDLAARLAALVTSGADAHGVRRFAATEARFMRYRGDAGGLGPHRDGMCYGLVVAVYSLAGSAEFTVLPDGDGPTIRLLVEPGDLLLLRAPGFDGEPDGRRRHAVGPPLCGGERVSLTLRMVGRHGGHRRSDGWSPKAG